MERLPGKERSSEGGGVMGNGRSSGGAARRPPPVYFWLTSLSYLIYLTLSTLLLST